MKIECLLVSEIARSTEEASQSFVVKTALLLPYVFLRFLKLALGRRKLEGPVLATPNSRLIT
ncbi:MAG: hypothetical protein JOZ19_16300, partial [Rubrobacter sp.]|nr:hypothetical protein [Rubrobacter sp.]